MQDKIKIMRYANSIYRKCDCCGRPKDNIFKILIMDSTVEGLEAVAGELSFCRSCGENFANIIKSDVPPESMTKETKLF